MPSKPKPLLLSISLYSMLVVQMILLSGLIYALLNFQHLDNLYSIYHIDSQKLPLAWQLYLPLLMLITFIYAVIQMLRRKKHAVFIFYILSGILFLLLIISQPIEWINIFILIFMNYMIFMNYSWFKHENTDEEIELHNTHLN